MRSCGHKTSATNSTVARPLRASNMASQEQNEWQPELTDEQILAFEQKIKDEEAEKVYYDIDNWSKEFNVDHPNTWFTYLPRYL